VNDSPWGKSHSWVAGTVSGPGPPEISRSRSGPACEEGICEVRDVADQAPRCLTGEDFDAVDGGTGGGAMRARTHRRVQGTSAGRCELVPATTVSPRRDTRRQDPQHDPFFPFFFFLFFFVITGPCPPQTPLQPGSVHITLTCILILVTLYARMTYVPTRTHLPPPRK